MLFPAESDLVRRDRALKGLGLLFNPDELTARLAPFLSCGKPIEAQATYIRYKPRTSCLVSYTFGLDDGNSIQIYAKTVKHLALNKLRKANSKFQNFDSGLPGVILFEDDATAFFVFPSDARIKALADLASSEKRPFLMRKLLPGHPDIWGADLENIRYKPEKRFVGRLSIKGNPVAKIKLYNPSLYNHSNINAKAFCSKGALRLPERIGRSSRHQIVVFEWVEGRLLSDTIMEPDFDPDLAKTTGAALSVIHSQNANGLNTVTRYDESSYLLQIATDLGFIFPNLEKRINELAKSLSDALGNIPQLNYPIHGDFYSEQILIQDHQAIVLDLDNAAYSDPAADLGQFIAFLEKDSLDGILSSSGIDTVKSALQEGYEGAAKNIPRNIELYTAIGLLRIAANLYKSVVKLEGYETKLIPMTESVLERAWNILQKNARRIHSHSLTGLSSNVPVYDPFDISYQPLLARALDPAGAEMRLRECLPDATGTGQKQIDLRAIRVTRYKPGKRCIIEYDVGIQSAETGAELVTLVGKVRMRGTNNATYSLAQSLWRQGFDSDAPDKIIIPEPFGIIPEYRMWLQRKVPGNSVIQALTGSDGPALARRIVEAIHKLQQAKVTPHRKQHTIKEELDILHTGLTEVAQTKPEWSGRINRIEDKCIQIAGTLSQCEPVYSHRDFYFDHVIMDGDRLYLLDFDLYCMADPGLDIGNFIGHLTEYAIRSMGDSRALTHIEEEMAQRFAELYDESAYRSMHIYTLLTLIRHIYLSTRVEKRNVYTQALLELCEERLATEAHATAPSQ